MVITKPTIDDFSDTTVMRVIRKIVEYIIDTLVPAINEGGGGSSYVLPPATKSALGGIIVGDNLTVDGSGKVNAPTPYTLPIGGTNIGGVKNGGNVTIETDGTMNVSGGSVTIKTYEGQQDIRNIASDLLNCEKGSIVILNVPVSYGYSLYGTFIKQGTSDNNLISVSSIDQFEWTGSGISENSQTSTIKTFSAFHMHDLNQDYCSLIMLDSTATSLSN